MCDWHLREIVEIMEPEWLIGVGGFAKKRAEEALTGNRNSNWDHSSSQSSKSGS